MGESLRDLLRSSWEFLEDVKRNTMAAKIHCIRMVLWMHPLDMFFSSLHVFLLQKQCLGAACWRRSTYGGLCARSTGWSGSIIDQCPTDGRLYMLFCFYGDFYSLLWGLSFWVGLLYHFSLFQLQLSLQHRGGHSDIFELPFYSTRTRRGAKDDRKFDTS